MDDKLSSPTPDDWDFEGLARELNQMGLDGDLDAASLAEIGVHDDTLEHVREAVDATLEEREKRHGEDVWAQVERLVLLRTIDTLWVDHLTELDDMRRGIGLRGYAGIDPLNEFKREAFTLYEELRGFISRQVANTIFRVQVTPAAQPLTQSATSPFRVTAGDGNGAQPDQITPVDGGHLHSDGTFHRDAPAPAAAGVKSSPAAAAKSRAAVGAGGLLPGLAATQRRGVQLKHGDEPADAGAAPGTKAPASAAKLGRNDLCWCGSGKKFKRCHGA